MRKDEEGEIRIAGKVERESGNEVSCFHELHRKYRRTVRTQWRYSPLADEENIHKPIR